MKKRLHKFALSFPEGKPHAVLTVTNPDRTAQFTFEVPVSATIKTKKKGGGK